MSGMFIHSDSSSMLVEDAPSSSSRPNLATSDSFQIASSSGPNHQRAPNGPWYDDGNIVVLAENTVFKVYKGILAESCDAFREMFSFPQPDELPAEELWEGCPLVPLTDSPQEVSVFLKAIFKESTFLRVPAKQTYPNVLSILRLSNKYGNAELQFKALEHLSTTLPTTLSEFDAVDATKTLASPRRVDRFRAADIIAESGETWLLPMALFRVIQMCTVEKIYMGVTEGEETVKMSSRNQLACLQAYVKNIKAVREILTFLSPVPSSVQGCKDRERCNAIRHKFLAKVEEKSRENESWSRNPFNVWSHFSKTFNKGVCASCKDMCEEEYEAKRQKYWEDIPKMFGIQKSWHELEEMKKRALKWPRDDD